MGRRFLFCCLSHIDRERQLTKFVLACSNYPVRRESAGFARRSHIDHDVGCFTRPYIGRKIISILAMDLCPVFKRIVDDIFIPHSPSIILDPPDGVKICPGLERGSVGRRYADDLTGVVLGAYGRCWREGTGWGAKDEDECGRNCWSCRTRVPRGRCNGFCLCGCGQYRGGLCCGSIRGLHDEEIDHVGVHGRNGCTYRRNAGQDQQDC